MKITSRTKVYAAPRDGTSAYEYAHYCRKDGLDKIRVRLLDISNDVPGERSFAWSRDNGQTWPETAPAKDAYAVPGGTHRVWPCEHFVDPVNGRQIYTSIEGTFAKDELEQGFKVYYLTYRTSADGGRTTLAEERIIQRGYPPENPVPGVWIGRNAFMTSGPNSMLRLPDGRILMVIGKSVLAPGGDLYNPHGSLCWLEVLALFGTWRDDGKLDWTSGPVISLSPELSTRGIFEPTLAQLPDGRILMVARGSNGGPGDPEGKHPAHKWYSVSSNGGFTWTYPEPWKYTDGAAFYSCSSMPQLLPHSNGKLYWMGNISETKPVGNGLRDKLYIGEVDQKSLMLKRESLFLIAQRSPNDPPTQLSNFNAHEDRATKEIAIYLPWFVSQPGDKWGADSWVYRLEV